MKNGRAKRRIWAAVLWIAALAECAWGVELPWEWVGRMEFGGERTEWVVDLDGAPERVEVRLEGGGGTFLVDEASWDGVWNGTPLGEFRSGTGGGWMATGLEPDAVTRHLRFRSEGGSWVLSGVRVAGDDGLLRVAFDREDGFEVAEGEDGASIHARVENGGGGWFGKNAWESDAAGKGDGAVFWVDTGKTGWHWARVRAGCDGSDEEVEGVIRWRVVPQGDNSPAGEPPSPPAKSRPKGTEDGGSQPESPPLTPRATMAEYYAACYGADGQLLTGAELKAVLCGIVNTGTRTNSYGSNLDSILQVTDACPTNSGLVQCIYLQQGISSFNKEHLWPKSHGIDEGYPAYSDLHHLRASDSTMNSTRGNLDFDTCRGLADAKEKNGCWYTKSAWEPPDSSKGDVARAVMYMAVRYETGATPVGDLELVEAVGTRPGTNALGRLSTLLDWNELDPVDAFETNRNELIYARYQGNRNPFIDHPEWARRVFAPESWDGKAGASVVVTNLDASQRYPWNGLVDIDYEVAVQGGRGNEDVWVDVVGLDGEAGKSLGMWSLSGSGAAGPVKAGRYRMTWDMAEDEPGLVSDMFLVRMFAGSRPASYWVVDMGGGPTAERWDVETWEGEPVGGWTEEHKTTKLVLRRIGAGTFAMGSPPDELGRQDDENRHEVILTRPYCMGVFEVTQKQWVLAMGTFPSTLRGESRPVEGVAYTAIRGALADWPDNHAIAPDSFLGVLQTKTGLEFDLPTEAQWEYACRADTATALNSGKDLSGTDECGNLAELGRYLHNRDDGCGGYGEHTEAGSYLPNAWGLFDMHGNVAEWCLDWYGAYDTAAVTNPAGATSGEGRVQRGGDWCSAARSGRSAWRGHAPPSFASASTGFRVAAGMEHAKAQRMVFAEIGPLAVTECAELTATATSGDEVVFSVVSGPGVVDGNKLSFSGTGTVVVRARQAGNEAWWPVTAEQAVTVYRAAQKLDFAPIGAQTVTNRVELSATATGGGRVEFAVVSGPAEIEDNVLTFTEPGVVEVSATQAGDGYWAPVNATQTFRVLDVGLLFAVNVDPGIANGSVVPDVAAATEGETVTLTVVPDAGWKLSSLSINGEPIKGRSFVMPGEDIIVSAVFVERLQATYLLVEKEEDFEVGAEYLVVAQSQGLFASAMRNMMTASRIGVEEVEHGADDTIVTDSDSIVWRIGAGVEEGYCTIYNAEADVYASSMSAGDNYAQLLSDARSPLAQWTLDLGSLPQVKIYSVKHPERWLSRNSEPLNNYFATYQAKGVLPRLYKRARKGEIDVRFDKNDGFSIGLGLSGSITASARNGTKPYAYVWTSATPELNGSGPTIVIPATLPTGNYTVQVEVTDADLRQATKTIGFTMGAGREQNFDAWGRHDSFGPLFPDWSVDSGKTILNTEMYGGVLISRYIENAGNTKAIEIFNGTASAINLKNDHYYLQQYDNGSSTPTVTIPLTNGIIPAGRTFAVTRTFPTSGKYPPDSALRQFGAIGGLASRILRTDALTFNGDDVIVLRKGPASGRIVDRVGQVSANVAGSLWSRMASDHTLVRKSNVTNGNTNAITSAFDLSEWTVLDNGNFGDLGAHAFTAPDAGYLPSGYSLLLDSGASLATPPLKGGIGAISFLARAQGAATGGDLVLAIESAPGGNFPEWSNVATLAIPLSQTEFFRCECFAVNDDHTMVRFRHLHDGSTNRIRLDDIAIDRAHPLKRTENFSAWTNAFHMEVGTHAHAHWTLCGRIATNGMAGTLAGNLPIGGGFIQTPVFGGGIGQVSFFLCRINPSDAVQASLYTSMDAGVTWSHVKTFEYPPGRSGTFTNASVWTFIPSNGCARIVCDGGTADAIVDNISVGEPRIVRTLDFNDFSPITGYYSYSYKGWTLVDASIHNSTNVWAGNSACLRNGTISSPWVDSIGSIAFMYRMGVSSGDDKARLKVEVSSDNKTWTTLAAALAGTNEWQRYAYWFEASNDWHCVRITQTTSSKRIFIDDIAINDFSSGPAISFDRPDGFSVEFGRTDSIMAAASNGMEPYSYVWFSETPELNGMKGAELVIPETLAEGDYTVVAEVTDREGRKNGKVIHFAVVAGNETGARTEGRDAPASVSCTKRRNIQAHGTGAGISLATPENIWNAAEKDRALTRSSFNANSSIRMDGWTGQTIPIRVDARAGTGEPLDVRDTEWAVWDTAWTDGASRTEVTLERPDGTRETLGVAEGMGVRGCAEWVPGAEEWGMFALRLAAWDADGEPLEELLALRIRRMPADRAYAAWIKARGGTPETMPMEADADTDGATNWEEYVADTDPLDPEEIFESRLEVLEDGTLRVIPSVVSTGRIYRVRLHGNLLQDATWQDLGPGCPGIGVALGGDSGETGFGAVGVSLP